MKAFVLLAAVACAVGNPPNVLVVVVDDLGWDDMGFRAATPQIKTPNVDKYAKESAILEEYYVQPSCSPTRATILSGRYPLHTGIDNWIHPGSSYGLPVNETTIADMLLKGGYATAAVGKWHIGEYSYGVTPTGRGFESFYGFYGGSEDYYTHTRSGGYDFRYDSKLNCGKGCSQVVFDAKGHYSTQLFTSRAIEVIKAHDTSKPLFMYLAYQAVHHPPQAPDEYVRPYSNLTYPRSIYAGMLACMDEGFGNVTRAMEAKGMMDNTLLILTTDNGGPTETCAPQGSSNWPLRGSKCSLWEGGTKGAAFVWTGKAVSTGKVAQGSFKQFMHAADLMPTIAEATQVACPQCLPWDGVSQWKQLTGAASTPARNKIYYGMSDIKIGVHGPAMRVGCYKLILGGGGQPGGWSPNPSNGSFVLTELLDDPSFLQDRPWPANTSQALYNVCNDPGEHNALPLSDPDNQKMANSIQAQAKVLWNTGVPACPDLSCPGYSPNPSCPTQGPGPIDINGTKVWEPWCDN